MNVLSGHALFATGHQTSARVRRKGPQKGTDPFSRLKRYQF
jgi:hypothetical protein